MEFKMLTSGIPMYLLSPKPYPHRHQDPHLPAVAPPLAQTRPSSRPPSPSRPAVAPPLLSLSLSLSHTHTHCFLRPRKTLAAEKTLPSKMRQQEEVGKEEEKGNRTF